MSEIVVNQSIAFLSNQWWAVIASDYSVSIFVIGSFVVAVLKAWALIHPEAKSILCLFKGWIYGFPGMKKEDKPADTEPKP